MNRYISISQFDDANANGYSLVVFYSSCPHMCPGCHNPGTWTDKNKGEYFTDEVQNNALEHFKKNEKYYDNLVLSGGDPLCDDNIIYVLEFAKRFKNMFPNKTIWCYTGYTFEQLLENNLKKEALILCDYIKCGMYIKELTCIDNIQYDIRLATSNQRIYRKGIDY